MQVSPSDSWTAKVASATPGDSVVFAPGRYEGCLTGGVELLENITLLGSAGAAATIIDCDHSGRHFHVVNATVSIVGLTLEGGAASGETDLDGGCVLVVGTLSAVTVTGSVFRNCSASASGGAIAFRGGGSLIVRGCNMTGNVAAEGAGIHAAGSSYSVEVEDVTGKDNAASFSGGVLHFEGSAGTISIDGSLFANNTAGSLGGGITVTGTDRTYLTFFLL